MNRQYSFKICLINILLSASLIGCQSNPPQNDSLAFAPGESSSLSQDIPDAEKGSKKQATTPPGGFINRPIPRVHGPKRTVAVGKFDAIGAFTATYGNWDIGGGLAAMLTTALTESEQFIVVERANIQQLLAEQEMKAANITNRETGPVLGNLAGAQLLVLGAVTEFSVDDEGSGFGLSGGKLGRMFNAGLGKESATGKVVMDIRVVDTTTGAVKTSYKVSERIESSSFSFTAGYNDIALGGDRFWKTPLGEATRGAIYKAVQVIAQEASNTEWKALVVEYDGSDMYINAGTQSGLKNGDKFLIERVVKRLTDPQTGQLLSTRRAKIGTLQVDQVEERLAIGRFHAITTGYQPQRGDLVIPQ